MRKRYYLSIFILLGVAKIGILIAQSNPPSGTIGVTLPAFDAVSIRKIEKRHILNTGNGVATITTAQKPCEYLTDRMICQLYLKYLIREAFQLSKTEMVGVSKMDDELFLVQAVTPLNTGKETARLMLQQALEERFGLKFHREEREVPVYALIPGKRGVKLQPADDPAHRKLLDVATPTKGRGASVAMSWGHFSAVAMSLDTLADDLNLMAGMELPVVNMTGLTGEYKINLQWNPVEGEQSTSLKMLDSGFPDAVQSQLGLKLEKRKFLTKVFVVDHIDPVPTDN